MQVADMRVLFIAAAAVAGVLVVKPFLGGTKPIAIPPAAAGQTEGAPRPVKENVVAYSTRDARMIAAKDRARETLPRFLALMNAKAPGTYSVKFPLAQNGATEHIWLQVDAYRDGRFHGRLANAPVNGDRYRMGDRLTVPSAQMEDWTVMDRDVVYGGYTARVALADMPQERATALAKRFRD
ncbi:hypothetical protein MOX02_38710 [Methylobacterium oxalidis]|uniref:DUF2314 domain-containing protein n=2 Tax=Methylobacterium oxalidis TaxID=944322 RepID=A0A512J7B7_9HYPH|nr:hypothetical protein MOX02_38710 [Methylobacterium oxalidis]GLS66460.1 hypothetical protein GCM10007888_48430 [Methylobacterium oxalidis]